MKFGAGHDVTISPTRSWNTPIDDTPDIHAVSSLVRWIHMSDGIIWELNQKN